MLSFQDRTRQQPVRVSIAYNEAQRHMYHDGEGSTALSDNLVPVLV